MSTDKWTLEEVCEKGSSSLMQKNLKLGTGAFPIYGASGLLGFVDFYHRQEEYIGIVKDGAGVGRAMLLPAQSSCIGTMQYLIPNQNVTAHYLYYAIQNMNLAKYNTGATIPHIYFRDYKRESIPKRSIQEQEIISEKIDKVENIIKIKREQLSHLDDLVKSQFIEMFGDPVLNPYNWPIVKIGEIAKDVRYGTSKPAVDGGRYPYLRMNNLTYEGFLDLSNLKYIDIPDDEIEKCIVRKGDILFNRTNSIDLVGKTCVFDLETAMVIAGYIIRIRLNDKLLPIVFSNYMNLPVLKKRLKDMAKGAVNQANINAQELKSVNIYLPPFKLQNQFALFVEQTDKSKVLCSRIKFLISLLGGVEK